MSKVGRNFPCPCGSGKKFKRCCLDKKDSNITSSVDLTERNNSIKLGEWSDIENLDEWSNNSLNLIKEGKLEEAEIITKKLLQDFPELHDGWERMAMIYEVRKDYIKAEECYMKADHIVMNSDGYENEFADFLKGKAKKMRSMIR